MVEDTAMFVVIENEYSLSKHVRIVAQAKNLSIDTSLGPTSPTKCPSGARRMLADYWDALICALVR